jgi:hypothetical protein
MGSVNHKTKHKTKPVWVVVDVDLGIAETVEYLNTIPGVRTHSSCQGSIGEGGPEPYGPYVEVSWSNDIALTILRAGYEVELTGIASGTVRLRYLK